MASSSSTAGANHPHDASTASPITRKTFIDDYALFIGNERRVKATKMSVPNTTPFPGMTIQDRKTLLRDLMLGTGFYNWMTATPAPAPADGIDALAGLSIGRRALRQLPVTDYWEQDDNAYIDSIVQEALEEDHSRFRTHLSIRTLGLGIITGAAGTGKTTALAAAALAMRGKFGPVLCVAPTDIAANVFAARIAHVAASVTERRNKMAEGEPISHKLVVRGQKTAWELSVLWSLLKEPDDMEGVMEDLPFAAETCWCFDLSVAYWVLFVLRSHAAVLHGDIPKAIRDLRAEVDQREDLATLRDVATGAVDFALLRNPALELGKKIGALMIQVVDAADFLCITPSAAHDPEYTVWKEKLAEGIVIDDANNMDQADLISVFGNILRPCFIGGDPKQLPPPSLAGKEKDADDNLINRLAPNKELSSLEFLMAMGLLVYRMRVQTRMAKGLFDIVSKLFYPELPCNYAPHCEITQPQFEIGRKLEAFIQERFKDDKQLKAPANDELSPLFIHCEGSFVDRDRYSESMCSQDQVTVALDFALDFIVSCPEAKSEKITFVTLYSINAELIERATKNDRKYIEHMRGCKASTIEDYRGQENDIIVVITGTNQTHGPGLAADKHLLSMLLTRQRAGLVVIGDINVTKSIKQLVAKDNTKSGKDKWKGDYFKVLKTTGEVASVNAKALQDVHIALWESGRVVTVPIKKEGKSDEAEKEKGKGVDKQ